MMHRIDTVACICVNEGRECRIFVYFIYIHDFCNFWTHQSKYDVCNINH